MKLVDEKQGKDLIYEEYFDWLPSLHSAKLAFMSEETSEDEIIEVIRRLDLKRILREVYYILTSPS